MIGNDGERLVDDTTEQSAMPTQIIATKPAIETYGEVKINETDDVTTTGPNRAEDVPVGAIQPIYSRSDDQSAADDTID